MINLPVISHFFQLRKVIIIIIKLQKLIVKWLRSTNMVIGYGTCLGTNRCKYREIMSDMMLYYLGFEPLSLLSIHLGRRVAGPRGSYLTDKFIRLCYDIIKVPLYFLKFGEGCCHSIIDYRERQVGCLIIRQ